MPVSAMSIDSLSSPPPSSPGQFCKDSPPENNNTDNLFHFKESPVSDESTNDTTFDVDREISAVMGHLMDQVGGSHSPALYQCPQKSSQPHQDLTNEILEKTDTVPYTIPNFKLPDSTSSLHNKDGLIKLIDNVPLLEAIMDSQAQVDTLIVCKDGKLGAHRVILQAWSPLLKAIFNEQKSEEVAVLMLPDTSTRMMNLLLSFAYNGSIKYTKGEEEELLSTMEYLLFGEEADLSLTTTTLKTLDPSTPALPTPSTISNDLADTQLISTSSSLASSSSTSEMHLPNSSDQQEKQKSQPPPAESQVPKISQQKKKDLVKVKKEPTQRKIDDYMKASCRTPPLAPPVPITPTQTKNSKQATKKPIIQPETNGMDIDSETDNDSDVSSGSLEDDLGKNCQYCERKFKDVKTAKDHAILCNSLKVTFEEQQKLSFCGVCNKQYKSIPTTNVCLLKHDYKRCLFCLEIFKSSDLVPHIQTVHSISYNLDSLGKKKIYRPVQCKFCTKMISVENAATISAYSLHCTKIHFSKLFKVKGDNEGPQPKRRKISTTTFPSPSPSLASSSNSSPYATRQNTPRIRTMEGNQIQVPVNSGVPFSKVIDKMNQLVSNATKDKPIFKLVDGKCTIETANIPDFQVKLQPISERVLAKIQRNFKRKDITPERKGTIKLQDIFNPDPPGDILPGSIKQELMSPSMNHVQQPSDEHSCAERMQVSIKSEPL